MIEVQVSVLIGPALDWAAAKADGRDMELFIPVNGRVQICGMWSSGCTFAPSIDGGQGWPIIAEHGKRIGLELRIAENSASYLQGGMRIGHTANTVLVAAMRAIVAAILGDTVSVPVELMGVPHE